MESAPATLRPLSLSPFRGVVESLLAFLPRGNTLPGDVWLGRHRAVLTLILIQSAALSSTD